MHHYCCIVKTFSHPSWVDMEQGSFRLSIVEESFIILEGKQETLGKDEESRGSYFYCTVSQKLQGVSEIQ